MTNAKPWALALFAALVLAAAGCSKSGGGDGGSADCAAICDAAADCAGDPSDAAAVRSGCLEECGNVSASCLADIGQACLECFQACDASCPETACACPALGQPGDPCQDNYDCEPGSICYNASYCVGTGSLRVTLSFQTDSDFDLHVLTPNGYEIYWDDRAEDGGVLDVDQCIQSETCLGSTHVENVVFASTASPGAYQVWVVNYDGRGQGAFQVEVAQGTDTQNFTGSLPAEMSAESQRFSFTVN